MKHIWWGTIALIAVFTGAWTAATVAGSPTAAATASDWIKAAVIVGGILLVFSFFFWIQDD